MSTGVTKLESYEHISIVMRDVVANYLLDNDHLNALKVCHQTPKFLDLPWKTTHNVADRGIFCIRHMETYIGGGVKRWKCGLVNESYAQCKQLNKLRIKYLCKIRNSSVNFLKDDVLVYAKTHDVDPEKKKIAKDNFKAD
ncbi:hypothetical protein R6Q57_006033 [Mikania cordata]